MGGSVERYLEITRQEAPPGTPAGAAEPGEAREEEQPGSTGFSVPRAVSPRPVPPDADLRHPHLYFNRELSWLDFNWRVLYQAMDGRVPLLERARYLAITQSNLDEFFAKRVGGLKRQVQARVTQLSADGRTPTEQLALIREAVLAMQEAMCRAWEHQVRPALQRSVGVRVVKWAEVAEEQRPALHDYFRSDIYPILTPLAVDPAHPFPFISNLSHSLAVVLRHPRNGTQHFARIKIPTARGRWVSVGRTGRFLPLEELVRAHVAELFPGMSVVGTHLFRVTRNADSARDEEEASDLVLMIAEELRERRFAPVVRLEIENGMPEAVLALLCHELRVDRDDVYPVSGLQDLTALAGLANLDVPDRRFAPWEPVTAPPLNAVDGEDIFSIIRRGDILVHHPYDSFATSVERFVEAAAADRRVLAIKQTLYRTSEESPIVRSLMRAAESGKQVAVLVEVTARFDEARNIGWAEQLEDSGAHVTYGVLGLKTHAKVTLVVREEEGGIRSYCHIGTGNYHSTTARLYTDLGLLTADEVIGRDVVDLLHSITGYAAAPEYERLIVAPHAMRDVFESLIRNEMRIQAEGGAGRIIAKMNAIDDTDMIALLYEASRAGVQIDLVVRGHTRLRPGLTGVSENIRVLSIIGRFLEHDRVFWFGNGGGPRVFMGSADWRRRNLEERIEAVVEIDEPRLRDRLTRVLELALEDNREAWDLRADGMYVQRRPKPGEPVRAYQRALMRDARRRAR